MLGVYCGVEASFEDCVSAFVQGWMAYMSGIVSRARIGDVVDGLRLRDRDVQGVRNPE
jgi:hypothetical protein